jgi:hypothetical protein
MIFGEYLENRSKIIGHSAVFPLALATKAN